MASEGIQVRAIMYDVNRELTELRKRVFDLEHTLAGFQPAETVLQALQPPSFIPWPQPPVLPFTVRGWTHDLVFSATDYNTVAWASGTITLDDGTAFSIGAANTGDMAADTITYIYFDLNVSNTALQSAVDSASSAVGGRKILVAVAAPVPNVATDKAIFQVFGGKGIGVFIAADNVAANTLTANEIAANTLTANEVAANTLLATNLHMGIGDTPFSAAAGLLLLGPNCEINATEWWSLRKQKATTSGALHQEAGRWLGTRALRVEGAGENLFKDPVCGYDATLSLWSDWSGGGTFASSRSTSFPALYSDYIGLLNNSGEAGVGYFYQTITVAAVYHTLTARVRRSDGAPVTAADCRLRFNTGQATPTYTSLGGGWYLLKHTGVVTAGARQFGIHPQAGRSVYVNGIQLEVSGCATSFIWWGAGIGYGGSVTTTSTRTATQVNLDTYARLLSGNTTWSVGLWVQMPYDWDANWPQQYNYLFQVYEDANNHSNIHYDATANKIRAYYVEGGVAVYSEYELQFAAGDWVHTVYNVNTGGNLELFVDGVLRDTDDLSARSNITPTEMNLGTSFAGTSVAHATYCEFVIFDKVLTTTEVAAIYALQRPLVDAGAMDTPGIYILDGRFKMASSLTGAHIDINADYIAGYSDATTKEFYIQASDGKAVFAGGDTVLGEDGAAFSGDYVDLRFINSGYNTVAFGADLTGPGIVAYEYVSGWKGLWDCYWNSGNPLLFRLDPNGLATAINITGAAPLTISTGGTDDITVSAGGAAAITALGGHVTLTATGAGNDIILQPVDYAYCTRGFAIPQAYHLCLEGPGSDTFFVFDGTNVKLYVNGVLKATW